MTRLLSALVDNPVARALAVPLIAAALLYAHWAEAERGRKRARARRQKARQIRAKRRLHIDLAAVRWTMRATMLDLPPRYWFRRRP